MRDLRYIMSCSNPREAFEGTSVMLPSIRAAPGLASPIISPLAKSVSSFFWQVDGIVIPSLVLNDYVHLCLNKAEDPI